jgi:hypothetical protein
MTNLKDNNPSSAYGPVEIRPGASSPIVNSKETDQEINRKTKISAWKKYIEKDGQCGETIFFNPDNSIDDKRLQSDPGKMLALPLQLDWVKGREDLLKELMLLQVKNSDLQIEVVPAPDLTSISYRVTKKKT